MKLQLIGHNEKYALEQSLLTLFPDERPVYGAVEAGDARWAIVSMTEDAAHVEFVTELSVDGKTARCAYACPLSGDDYAREGQRRHALGLSFFGDGGRRGFCGAVRASPAGGEREQHHQRQQ